MNWERSVKLKIKTSRISPNEAPKIQLLINIKQNMGNNIEARKSILKLSVISKMIWPMALLFNPLSSNSNKHETSPYSSTI